METLPLGYPFLYEVCQVPLPLGNSRDHSVIPLFLNNEPSVHLPSPSPGSISLSHVSILLLTPFPKSKLLPLCYLIKGSPVDLNFWKTKARKRIVLETKSPGVSLTLSYSLSSRNLHRGPETHYQAARVSSYVIAFIMYMAHGTLYVPGTVLGACFYLFTHSHNY